MEKYDIVIIDSGLDNYLQKDGGIYGMAIKENADKDGYFIDCDYIDLLGHGTAVYSIVKQHNPNLKIFNVKIFEEDATIDENKLIFALEYIYKNIDTNIINMSLGLPMPMQKELLENAVNNLSNKGVILVAAFDNSGCISYPAAFDDVIGVASHDVCKKISDFYVVENSPINIYAKGRMQRVSWLNQSCIVMGGNSFACAHFTGILSHILNNMEHTNIKSDLYNRIKERAISTYIYPCQLNENKFNLQAFKNVALVPFNKEIHSLIRYEELLNFKIVDIYDSKYTARVGSTTNTLLNINKAHNYTIKNLDSIDWDSFDSIVVGHLEETSKNSKTPLLNKLINEAISHRKNIYSFDNPNLTVDYENLYFPSINTDTCKNSAGKLYRIGKPILCVAGTSSKQGKFSLQLELRKRLSNVGYKVGQLGTEPSSLLFGMDECFHFGYNSTYELSDSDFVLCVNQLVNNIANSNCDIIISGCQSEMLHQDLACTENMVFPQLKFLSGLQPDAVILVVNPHDEVEYIKKIILFLYSFVNADVIGIVLYPMKYKNINSGIFGGKIKISEIEANVICEKLNKTFDLPVYSLDNVDGLIDNIIDYFQ